jgi:hypothetical protein
MPDVFVEDNSQPENQPQSTPPQPAIPPVSQKSMPFFAAYCQHPKGITFDNQEADEHVILFLRRHPITNLSWIIMGTFLLALPIAVLSIADMFTDLLFLVPLPYMLVIVGFYYLIVLGYLLLSFVSWFYNLGIITTKQIFDLDFHDIMYRNIAKSLIEDVIDVEFTQGGFLRSILNIGNVFIQTESLKPNFEFQSIPKPDKVTDIIINLKGGKLPT